MTLAWQRVLYVRQLGTPVDLIRLMAYVRIISDVMTHHIRVSIIPGLNGCLLVCTVICSGVHGRRPTTVEVVWHRRKSNDCVQ